MTPDLDISVAGRTVNPVQGGLVILLIGCAVLGYGAYDYQRQSDALQGATTVNATVTETGIERISQRRGTPDYRPSVTFEYRFEGSRYTSGNVYPGSVGPTFETRADAEARLEAYQTGATVTAYVLPAEPARAYLEPERTDAPLKLLGMGGLFTVVGLGSVLRSTLGG